MLSLDGKSFAIEHYYSAARLNIYANKLAMDDQFLTSSLCITVAVGMAITGHPPHRSGRALLTHPAPILGIWRKTAAQDKDALFADMAAIS